MKMATVFQKLFLALSLLATQSLAQKCKVDILKSYGVTPVEKMSLLTSYFDKMIICPFQTSQCCDPVAQMALVNNWNDSKSLGALGNFYY